MLIFTCFDVYICKDKYKIIYTLQGCDLKKDKQDEKGKKIIRKNCYNLRNQKDMYQKILYLLFLADV